MSFVRSKSSAEAKYPFATFAGLAHLVPGILVPRWELALPLGISFFTFHHIMYLTDLRRGEAPGYDLVRYALYIGFFPQVLAGPLVRWREIMAQLEMRFFDRPDAAEMFARGMLLLLLGLVKKVAIADPLAAIADPVFTRAATGVALSASQAWQGTLAFSLQIYFDFSGYTDMALGIAMMFGIILPQNFNVPYRAVNLQEFWRRWHMTLSRFLRDYLYIPLGGNRGGLQLQIWALLATMLLGGLWHGANWTFVVWGGAHGVGLAVGLLWRRSGRSMPVAPSWLATMLFVALTWVLFRAESFAAALTIYEGMLGYGVAGDGMKWSGILPIAAAAAILGPTSWALAHGVRPWRWAWLAYAIAFVAVVSQVGDSGNGQFIYFQF